jgi:mannose-1-phosphate guanylyltransferase/mannose-6-phosphate isomerase
MYSVILCGGSGTRLWPLSRKNYPKQFLALSGDKSLLQETFLRMRRMMSAEHIFFVTNKENFFNVLNQIREIYPTFAEKNIIMEPASRNTLPAIAYAVKYLQDTISVPLSEPILFAPADHLIVNSDAFAKLLLEMEKEVGSSIGTIGITPTKPETGYGYIQKGEAFGGHFAVSAFKEKPAAEVAEEYVKSGKFLWNSGMYMFSIKTFVEELKKYAPEVAKVFQSPPENFLENFSRLPALSIDNGISEKSDRVIVFEGNFGWSDIGSFDSLAEATLGTAHYSPRHVGVDSQNVFVHSTSNRLIVTLGVDDLVVVENNDSILIHKKGRSEDVKKVLRHLEENKYPEIEHNVVVHRPWGRYEVLLEAPFYKTKKLLVYPGKKLSLQSHQHRAEHWVVVSGVVKVTKNDETFLLQKNESTFIPSNTKHRIENPGKVNLEIIEVQTGEYLGEDDIARYEDDFKRI